jgi:hypothetical protein
MVSDRLNHPLPGHTASKFSKNSTSHNNITAFRDILTFCKYQFCHSNPTNMQYFLSTEHFNAQWQFYTENEVRELANKDVFTIDHYADSEIFNPDIQNFILEYGDLFRTVSAEMPDAWALGLREKRQLKGMDPQIQLRFQQLKTWLKQVICELLGSIDWENKSTKEIILLIITTMIPYFAATGGLPLPAVILPIMIAVIAKIMKLGVDAVCTS